jgi:hypothetical protein
MSHARAPKGIAVSQSLIMKVAAVFAAIAGIAALFAPNEVMALYNAPPMNGPGVYNTMLYGASVIGFAVMNWTASQGTAQEARHVIQGAFVAYALALAVVLYQQTTQPTPGAAWINVLIFAVFTALYGYLQFGPQRAATPASA